MKWDKIEKAYDKIIGVLLIIIGVYLISSSDGFSWLGVISGGFGFYLLTYKKIGEKKGKNIKQ